MINRRKNIFILANLIFVFLLLPFGNQISAQYLTTENEIDTSITVPDKPLLIKAFVRYHNGSSYYDQENDLSSRYIVDRGEFEEPLYTDFTRTTYFFGLAAEYRLTDKLLVFGEIPFATHNLDEELSIFVEGDLKNFEDRNYGRDQIEYFALGGFYRIYEKKAYADLWLESRIPSGNEGTVLPQDTSQFLSDGAFEMLFGAKIGADISKIKFMTQLGYHYRGEELRDLFRLHTEAGIATVEATTLKIYLDFLQTVSNFRDIPDFDPQYTTIAENELRLGFSFDIIFENFVYLEFGYDITVIGKNTFNYGNTYGALGFLF